MGKLTNPDAILIKEAFDSAIEIEKLKFNSLKTFKVLPEIMQIIEELYNHKPTRILVQKLYEEIKEK